MWRVCEDEVYCYHWTLHPLYSGDKRRLSIRHRGTSGTLGCVSWLCSVYCAVTISCIDDPSPTCLFILNLHVCCYFQCATVQHNNACMLLHKNCVYYYESIWKFIMKPNFFWDTETHTRQVNKKLNSISWKDTLLLVCSHAEPREAQRYCNSSSFFCSCGEFNVIRLSWCM